MNSLFGWAGALLAWASALFNERAARQRMAVTVRTFWVTEFMVDRLLGGAHCAVAACDVPAELVSVTDTLWMSVAFPSSVNGCVYVKLVPNWSEVEEPYQV